MSSGIVAPVPESLLGNSSATLLSQLAGLQAMLSAVPARSLNEGDRALLSYLLTYLRLDDAVACTRYLGRYERYRRELRKVQTQLFSALSDSALSAIAPHARTGRSVVLAASSREALVDLVTQLSTGTNETERGVPEPQIHWSEDTIDARDQLPFCTEHIGSKRSFWGMMLTGQLDPLPMVDQRRLRYQINLALDQCAVADGVRIFRARRGLPPPAAVVALPGVKRHLFPDLEPACIGNKAVPMQRLADPITGAKLVRLRRFLQGVYPISLKQQILSLERRFSAFGVRPLCASDFDELFRRCGVITVDVWGIPFERFKSMVLAWNQRTFIFVNGEVPNDAARQFCVAHECGHAALDHLRFETVDAPSVIRQLNRDSGLEAHLEARADLFAVLTQIPRRRIAAALGSRRTIGRWNRAEEVLRAQQELDPDSATAIPVESYVEQLLHNYEAVFEQGREDKIVPVTNRVLPSAGAVFSSVAHAGA